MFEQNLGLEEKYIKQRSHTNLVDMIKSIGLDDLKALQTCIDIYHVLRDLQDDVIKMLATPERMDLLNQGKIDVKQGLSYFLVNEIINQLLPVEINNTLRELISTPTVGSYSLIHTIIQDYIGLLREKLSDLFVEYRDLALKFQIVSWQFPKNIDIYLWTAIFQIIPGEILTAILPKNGILDFTYPMSDGYGSLKYGLYENDNGVLTLQL